MSAAPQSPPAGNGAVRLGSLDTLILITERLIDLITAENALLSQRRPKDLSKQIDEKQRLAAMYAREMASINKDPGRLQGAAPADVARLREVTQRFRRLIEENGRKVNAMRVVTERVVKSIGDEVAKRNRPVSGYDKHATMRPVTPNYRVARPTSLALDQRV
ncbi:MAG TPA: hypothetical protein VMU42_11215 [Candidatus Sulfotelmatobacter sp.]|nr:hypothetical protein [Candidatus Sulfotelmatobacter sp.]